MEFGESVSYLYSLGNEVEAMKLGLSNVRELLSALGNPQDKYKKIQIAGTNGKGSVCAFLNSICVTAHIKTGLYSSPHLVSITERIKIGGADISEAEFARVGTIVRETAEKLLSDGRLEYRPTFFEQMTAIALLCFADTGVDLAILETGMGGRLDATTAANAEIAAITRIDFDHQEYLGGTIGEIAAEKAAIIRKGMPVVIGEQCPEAMEVLTRVCANLGVSPRLAQSVGTTCVSGWPGELEPRSAPTGCFSISFRTQTAKYENLVLALLGRHQIENARTAILLAEELRNYFDISQADIVSGLQNARHPGRLEYAGRFLFDGAHNAAGARCLREYLDEFVDRPITLVVGAMKGKDIAAMANVLFPKADILILTQPTNTRAMPVRELASFVPENRGSTSIFERASVAEAIALAQTLTPNDGIILVTGSLYLVGEVKNLGNNS